MFRKIYEFLRILRSAISSYLESTRCSTFSMVGYWSGLFVQIVMQVYILSRGITLILTILVEDAIVSEIRMTRFLLEDRRSISHLF